MCTGFMDKKTVSLLVALLCSGPALPSPGDPVFSWDRVPVYLHFGSNSRMTDEQVETAARISGFICLEKAHGRLTDREHPERVATGDARRIRKANPDAKVLMYWNTLIAWPFTSYNRDFAKEHPQNWILRDRNTGEPLLKGMQGKTPVYQYNLLNPEVRKWWAETAGGAVKAFEFDGLFMDAVSQSKRPLWLQKGWGMDKGDALDAAAIDMMQKTKAIMGDDRLLIYNGLRSRAVSSDGKAAAGMEFLPYSDGALIEHFDQFGSSSKEDMLAYWEMADRAAKAGKIVLYKGWPDHNINWLNKEFMGRSAAEKEALARTMITYPLACYLIGARENSWFSYGWGYNINDGQLIEYAEYDRKLGAPKAEASRDKWVFRRDFKHARVRVDLEKREGGIQWLEQ